MDSTREYAKKIWTLIKGEDANQAPLNEIKEIEKVLGEILRDYYEDMEKHPS